MLVGIANKKLRLILKGQLVQMGEPSCTDGTSTYHCTRNDRSVSVWRFQPSGVDITLLGSSSPRVSTVKVGSARVTLIITAWSANSINITATISYSDAVELNGTRMDCNGNELYINVGLTSK